MTVCAVVEVHDRLEVPVPFAASETLVVVSALQIAGALVVNATLPTKLKVLVRVIVEVSAAFTLPLGEVAETVKSPTCEMKLAV